MRRQTLALAAVLALLLAGLAAPVGLAGAQETTPTPTPTAADGTGNEYVATPTPDGEPESTVSVRIVPVHFEQEYLSASRTDRGINTTGPFAQFELGRPAEQVEIRQPGASASLLSDGSVVHVQYDGGGTPGEASLYTLRLYFPDGRQTVDLYARDTDITVTSGGIEEYRPVVEELLDGAEEEGFEQSPEGTQNYVGYLQDRADLFENFFAEKFTAAIITIITWVTNPVGLLFTLLAAALAATWLYRNHGRVLDIISSDPGKSQRRRERIELERQEQIASAADEHLSDLPEVGTMGEVYWQDAYQVATVYELAELFRNGIPVSDGDDLYHVGGVEGLSASSVHESWLEPVVRDGRLASVEIALSHGAAALHRMMSKYGMAMEYRETYEQVRQLQEDLDDQAGYGRSHSFDIDGSPTGGDD